MDFSSFTTMVSAPDDPCWVTLGRLSEPSAKTTPRVNIPAMYDPNSKQMVFTSRTKVGQRHLLPLESLRVIRRKHGNENQIEILGAGGDPYVIEVTDGQMDHWFHYLQKERVEAVRLLEEHRRSEDPYYDLRHKMKGKTPASSGSPVASPKEKKKGDISPAKYPMSPRSPGSPGKLSVDICDSPGRRNTSSSSRNKL